MIQSTQCRPGFPSVAVFNVALGLVALSLAGCGAGGAVGMSTGAAGAPATTGQAGASASGAAGTGTAGEIFYGDASTASGAAGTAAPSGAAGAGPGAAGTGGGSAGTTGTAGTIGAAGTTGAAGATGTAGTTGAAGAAGTTGGPSGPSAGCTADIPNEQIGKAIQHNMTVTVAPAYKAMYTSRKYFTTMPMKYDPTKPYPVVFWGPGCGATGSEGSSFTTGHFLTDILYVQLLSVTGCFQAGKQGTADSPDGPYFDQALAEVEAHYCVDKSKVFVAGTSSGAWLSNYLACARGNVIRGAAADSGGLQHDHGTCTGGAAVMEMPGDSTTTIEGGFDIGSGPARDLFIKLDACSMTATTMSFAMANNCQVYGACSSPVVWCDVGGAHQSGNQKIAESAWTFWNTLK
jgi:poly(3-hydroxybutyrate) depolymerase